MTNEKNEPKTEKDIEDLAKFFGIKNPKVLDLLKAGLPLINESGEEDKKSN